MCQDFLTSLTCLLAAVFICYHTNVPVVLRLVCLPVVYILINYTPLLSPKQAEKDSTNETCSSGYQNVDRRSHALTHDVC